MELIKAVSLVKQYGQGDVAVTALDNISLGSAVTATSFRFPLKELLLSGGVLLAVAIGVSLLQMVLLKNKDLADCMKDENL